MKTIGIVAIIMLLFLPQRAFAYERSRFSLDEAIRYAVKSHPRVLIAQNTAEKQHENLKSVKIFHPNISFHGGYNMMTDREYFGISVSQDLDSIFDYKKNLTKARLDYENAIHEAELVNQDVIRSIREAYSEYSSKLNQLKLSLKSLNIEDKAFRLVNLQFKEGKIPLSGYLSQKKRLNDASYNAREARLAFNASREKLYMTIGYRK